MSNGFSYEDEIEELFFEIVIFCIF